MALGKFPIRLGILGGGQLARMLAMAAYQLGVEPVLFASSSDCATRVAPHFFLDDRKSTRNRLKALSRFIEATDVITIENEFIDLKLMGRELSTCRFFPSVSCLKAVQNKLHQKKALRSMGIPTLDFVPVSNQWQLMNALDYFPGGCVFKKSTLGYDGRGTYFFGSKETKIKNQLGQVEWPMEGFAEELVHFKKELAVVIARSTKGEIQAYPVIETSQKNGMCDWTVVPASVSLDVQNQAQRIARKVISGFGGVGVFGIEMFLLDNGRVVVNEVAPRVHNSGHVTMNAFHIGQFEQHLRAVLGWKLLKPRPTAGFAAMVNIVGTKRKKIDARFQTSFKQGNGDNSWIYWYDKHGEAFGRKLGHINAVSAKSTSEALSRARKLRQKILI